MKLPSFDQRGGIIVAVVFIALVFPIAILGFIAHDPKLLDNSAFMTFATALTTASIGSGGFGMIVNWAFGSTKSGSETAAKLADSVVTNPGNNPAPVDVTKPKEGS